LSAPRNLESKLDQEKLARQRAETQAQEKARELSMLTVDNRQLQYRLDKIQADFRQEADKVRYYTTPPHRSTDFLTDSVESVDLNEDQGRPRCHVLRPIDAFL
jgi:hypothetical protein